MKDHGILIIQAVLKWLEDTFVIPESVFNIGAKGCDDLYDELEDLDSEAPSDKEQLEAKLNTLKAIFFLLRNGKYTEAQEMASSQQLHEIDLLLMSFVPRHENLNSTEFDDFNFYSQEDHEQKVNKPFLKYQISKKSLADP